MTAEEHQQQLDERRRIEELIENARKLNDAFTEWAINEGLIKWKHQKSTRQ